MASLGMDSVGLAYHAGVSYDYIYKILRGERPNISAVNLGSIAHALGVSMEYLMGVSDEPEFARLFGDDGIPISETSKPWLIDTAMKLAAIAREIERMPRENQDAVKNFVTMQIQQIHKVVDTSVELGKVLASQK
jgi:transcriptional regulator with XRE-family HTH domain